MIEYIKFLFKRLVCYFKGHSHPSFNCFHCGARSPYEFFRDEDGKVMTLEGIPVMQWRGWGWRPNGK